MRCGRRSRSPAWRGGFHGAGDGEGEGSERAAALKRAIAGAGEAPPAGARAGGGAGRRRQTLSRYRFAHGLYQQYLYNHLGAAERRLLHRATAEVLEELYVGSLAEIAPQLAYHWGQAKDTDKTREYMLLAGQAALAAYANQDAERYFRQVLELEPDERSGLPRWRGWARRYACRRSGKRQKIGTAGIDDLSPAGRSGRDGKAVL